MHEVLLVPLHLASPVESGIPHRPDDRSVLFQRTGRAGPPRPAADQAATGTEPRTTVVQPVLLGVEVERRAVGMVAEDRAVAVPVERTPGPDHAIPVHAEDRLALPDQRAQHGADLGSKPVADRKGSQRRNIEDLLVFAAHRTPGDGVSLFRRQRGVGVNHPLVAHAPPERDIPGAGLVGAGRGRRPLGGQRRPGLAEQGLPEQEGDERDDHGMDT